MENNYKKIKIFIKNINGNLKELEVGENDSIARVTELYRTSMGQSLDKKHIRFLHNQKKLYRYTSLNEIGIKDSDVLHLMLEDKWVGKGKDGEKVRCEVFADTRL